ncbi:MAG: hydroxymethylglutaryl-CoA reductase [Theionarchaea archaeon]|nr:hydroxymethylglutaryl-CoA reductase [Theionarchaea archaeon]
MKIPAFVLKKLYLKDSLKNTDEGFEFAIKNTLMDATIISPVTITVDNKPFPKEKIQVAAEGNSWSVKDISDTNAVPLKVNVEVTVVVKGENLSSGKHEIEISASTKEYGDIQFSVKDAL